MKSAEASGLLYQSLFAESPLSRIVRNEREIPLMVISLNIFISLSVSTILFPSNLSLSYEDAGLATKALALPLTNADSSGKDVQLVIFSPTA